MELGLQQTRKERQKSSWPLAKLSLSNALQLRALRSILLEVHQVPTENRYIQEAVKATKAFAEAAKEMSAKDKEEQLGLPHIHVWNALLGVAMRSLEDRQKVNQDPTLQSALVTLKEYAGKYQELGWKAVHAEVKYARVQKNFKAELRRLEINVVDQSPSDEVWGIIKKDLKRAKDVRELPRMAPAGDLERQLQRFLDENNGTNGSR